MSLTIELLDVIKDAHGVEIAWRVQARFTAQRWRVSKDRRYQKLISTQEVTHTLEFFGDPFTSGYLVHRRGVGATPLTDPLTVDLEPLAGSWGVPFKSAPLVRWFWDNIASKRTP